MKEELYKIIKQVDLEKKYFGIIPFYPVYNKAKNDFNLSIEEFHMLLLQLEENEIYLEPINDFSRLNFEEKKIALYDKIRGYLYYIGFKN